MKTITVQPRPMRLQAQSGRPFVSSIADLIDALRIRGIQSPQKALAIAAELSDNSESSQTMLSRAKRKPPRDLEFYSRLARGAKHLGVPIEEDYFKEYRKLKELDDLFNGILLSYIGSPEQPLGKIGLVGN